MGKGTIISGGSLGEYSISVDFDTEAIAAKKIALQGGLARSRAEKLTTENGLAALESAHNALLSQQDALIDALSNPPTTAELAALNEKTKETFTALTEVSRKTSEVKSLTADITIALKEIARLESAKTSEVVAAWCADYSEDLTGEVGTIEIPAGEYETHVQIRQGYGGASDYAAARDGNLRQPFADVAAATFYNLAMQPGTQRWLPRYRKGIISALDETADTCTVTLDSAASGQQGLTVNYGSVFPGVSISYMDCDAEAFENGDHVIVEFINHDKVDPQGNNWLPGNMRVIGFVDNPEPCGYTGAFIFCPMSDDAAYGWGDPYDSGGTPINPPLGTVSSGLSCGNGTTVVDGGLHEHRLYDSADDPDFITHGTDEKGGRHFWKYGDYVISWAAPYRINDGASGVIDEDVYRNGGVLAYGPGGRVVGACLRKIGATVYLYVCRADYLAHAMIARAVVSPTGSDQALTWDAASGMGAAVSTMSPPFQINTAEIIKASFNKSGTHVAISQPGRLVVADLSTWGSAVVESDTWYENSLAVDPNEINSSIQIPVVAAYVPDSDDLREVSIKVIQQWLDPPTSVAFYNEPWIAQVIRDGEVIKEQALYVQNWTASPINANPSPGGVRDLRGYYFFCMYPWSQSPETDFYCYDTMCAMNENYFYHSGESDTPFSRERRHTHEIYRGSARVAVKVIDEEHPDSSSTANYWDLNWEKGLRANNRQLRDAYYFPQHNPGERNTVWLWASPSSESSGLSTEDCLLWIAQECIGVWMLDSTGTHQVIEHYPLSNYRIDQALYLSPHHFIGMAHHWNKAAVYSSRIFAEWDTATPANPVYEWWNVYVRTPDLMDEAEVTGSNQRMVARPCTYTATSSPTVEHIGIHHFSTENPFV